MKDYTITILSDGTAAVSLVAGDSLINNIYLSLKVKKGSFFARPDFGSRIHELKKNTANAASLLKDYVREALQWLIDAGRISRIEIDTERERYRLKYRVRAWKSGSYEPVTFEDYVGVV